MGTIQPSLGGISVEQNEGHTDVKHDLKMPSLHFHAILTR